MSIIGTLPDNLANGTTADASQVMADLNFIVNQVNANACPLGTLTAPSGTAMAFQQATAPTGWVAQTGMAYSDAVLRSVTPATYAGLGGSVGASVLILGPITGDGHSLTIAELAAHGHTDSGHTHATAETPHSHGASSGTNFIAAGGVNNITFSGSSLAIQQAAATTAVTTGLSVDSGTANIQNTGSGSAHSHTLTANCKFIDQIVAVKS